MDESVIPTPFGENLPPVNQRKNASFLSKYKFTLIGVGIILIALVPLLLISRNKSTTPATQLTAPAGPTATPTPIPLTETNASPTLTATDTSIQNALTQSNQDLNSVSQIDTTQDSTAGL